MNLRIRQVTQPVWEYVNQPIFDRQSVWKPGQFWYVYKINLLERCWQKESTSQSHFSQ